MDDWVSQLVATPQGSLGKYIPDGNEDLAFTGNSSNMRNYANSLAQKGQNGVAVTQQLAKEFMAKAVAAGLDPNSPEATAFVDKQFADKAASENIMNNATTNALMAPLAVGAAGAGAAFLGGGALGGEAVGGGLGGTAATDATIGNAIGGTVTNTGASTAALTPVADTGIAVGGPMPAGVTAGGGVEALNAAAPGAVTKGLSDAELATLGIGGVVGGTAATVAGTTPAITPTQAAVGATGAGAVANAVNPNADPNTNINTGPANGTTGQTTDPNSPGAGADGVVTAPTSGTPNPGGIGSTINDAINGVTGGSNIDWAKYLPAVFGGLLAANNNQPAPITQTPWNAGYFGPLQNQATTLMNNNNLQLPNVPTLPGMPDLANNDAAKAYADSVVKNMQNTFTDPGGPLSAIRSDFTSNQPGGGTRQSLAEGVAAGREGLNEGLARNQIMNAIYPTNLQYNQARSQQDIANQQWGFGQTTGRNTALFNAPWQNLSQAGNIFTGAAGKGSTTVLPSTPWWQSGVGGALATQGLVNAVNKG